MSPSPLAPAAPAPVIIGAATEPSSSAAAAAAETFAPSTATSSCPSSTPDMTSPAAADAGLPDTKLVPYPTLPGTSLGVVQEGEVLAQPPAAPPALPSSSTTPTTPVVPQDDSPKVALNVLVISGQRKTFRFDQEMTVGRVKEMIWSSWPAEWNSDPTQPPAPSYLRILYRGRMLDDESTLSSNSLPVLPAPRSTVVHLSVRTFPIEQSQDGKEGKDGDEQPTRPGLHTRASSRIRSFVGAAPAGVATTANPQITRDRRRRRSNDTNTTDGSHAGGSGGCGCVIA